LNEKEAMGKYSSGEKESSTVARFLITLSLLAYASFAGYVVPSSLEVEVSTSSCSNDPATTTPSPPILLLPSSSFLFPPL